MSEDHKESNENEAIKFNPDYFRSKANHFSLHDDLDLLKSLENLNNDILTKTDQTYRQLDTIENQVKIKSVQVVNLINEFQMLADSQFIENRVYDEGVQCHATKDEITNKTCQSNESHFISLIQESLQTSFKFIDENIKIVSRPNANLNDSDDEDNNDYLKDSLSVAIKNSAFHRSPLPYIIGTEDFLNESVFSDMVDNFDDITKNRFEYHSDSDEEDSNNFQNDNKSDSKSLSIKSVDNIHYSSLVQPPPKRDSINTEREPIEKSFEENLDNNNEDDLFSIVSSVDKFDSFISNESEIKNVNKPGTQNNHDNNSPCENFVDVKHHQAVDNIDQIRASNNNPLALSSKLLYELNARQNKLAKSIDEDTTQQNFHSLLKVKSINSLNADSSPVNIEKPSTKTDFEPSLSSKSTITKSLKQSIISRINKDNDDNDNDDIDIFKGLETHTKTRDYLFGPDNSDDDDYSVFNKKKSNDNLFSSLNKTEFSDSKKALINKSNKLFSSESGFLSSSDDEQIDSFNVSQIQKESKPIHSLISTIVSPSSQSSSINEVNSKNYIQDDSKIEKKNKSIFDWNSDSDDLFQTLSKEKKSPHKDLKNYKEEPQEKQIRKSKVNNELFSDSDNEDDLFTKKLNTNSKRFPLSAAESNKSVLINKIKPKLFFWDDSDNDSFPSKPTSPELNEDKASDVKLISTTENAKAEDIFAPDTKSIDNEVDKDFNSMNVNKLQGNNAKLFESDSEEDLFSLVKRQQVEGKELADNNKKINSLSDNNTKSDKETQKKQSLFSDDEDYNFFTNSKSHILDSHILSKDVIKISKNKEEIKKPLIYDIDDDPLFASILNKKNVTDNKLEHNNEAGNNSKILQIDNEEEIENSIHLNKKVDEQVLTSSEAFKKVIKSKSTLFSDESDDDNLFSKSSFLTKPKIIVPTSLLSTNKNYKLKDENSEGLRENLSEEDKFLPFIPKVLDNANLKTRAAIVASRKKHHPRKIRKKSLDENEN